MGRHKQEPKVKHCETEGCPKESECIVKIDGTLHDYCRDHTPGNVEVTRDKKSCIETTCPFRRTHGLPTHRGATHCQFHATAEMIHTSSQFCGFPGCAKSNPVFGFPGTTQIMRCGDHRLEGMVNVRDKMCICGEHQATHPAPGGVEKIYCGTCVQKLGIVTKNTKSCRKCAICGEFATYARAEKEHPTHCSKHGTPLGFIDVMHKKCEKCHKFQGRRTVFPDGSVHCLCVTDGGMDTTPICIGLNQDGTKCTTHASYDPDSVARPRYCIQHAPPGSTNIHAVLCKCPAKSRCTFNYPLLPPRFCGECKEEGMIDVVSARCKICHERAAYHSAKSVGDTNSFEWFCLVHKTADMIRSGGHPCCMPNCSNKEAIYGFPRGTAPLLMASAITHENLAKRYCFRHKMPIMIDIIHEMCECPMHKRATFYMPGAEDGQLYCAACRPPGAISENSVCDQCSARATFGPLFESAIHCAEHAQVKDSDGHDLFCEFTDRFPKCQERGCPMRPDFSVDETYYPSHCGCHAPTFAVAITEGICAKCQNARLINRATDTCGYCENNLGERNKAQRLARERRMLKVLTECGLVPHFHNKTHPILCAAGLIFRLDFIYESNVIIVLEDDEDQHGNKIISFGREEITPLLDLSGVIEYDVVAAIDDPDKHKKGKAPLRQDSTPDASGAGTSASTAESSEACVTTVRRKSYTRVKELARMVSVQQTFNVPVIFVRYNPDEFIDHEGSKWAKSRGTERDRIAAMFVKDLIDKYAQDAQSLRGLYVSYLYYNGQRPGIADSFNIDVEAMTITRVTLSR